MADPKLGNWKIRAANPGDWDQISSISTEIAEEGLIGNYISDIGPKYLTVGKTHVVEDEKIVAFHNVQDVADGSIYLSGLRVSGKYRKRGIALFLLQSALEKAIDDGKNCARAFVEPANKASVSLFTKLGFCIKEQVYLYFGSMDISNFSAIDNWPDTTVDIGHVPSTYYHGIPVKLRKKGKCFVGFSGANPWDEDPSFTIFNPNGCEFISGNSFIVSKMKINLDSNAALRTVKGFETAYLMEKELGGQ